MNDTRWEPEVSVRRPDDGEILLTVINWSDERRLSFDPRDAGFEIGQTLEVRDVEDRAHELINVTWRGSPVEIPLDRTDAVQSVGHGFERVPHTPRRFGTFLIMRGDR